MAVAWEGVGNTVAKLVRDRARFHGEVAALSGIHGRRGAGLAGVYSVAPRVRLVSQQHWSRHAVSEALNVVPAGTSGFSTIEGAEVQVRRGLEVYAYGGLVYASRSAGNRTVGQWSVGVNQTLAPPLQPGKALLSLEFSHLDRATWGNRTGQMNYLMARLRYSLN